MWHRVVATGSFWVGLIVLVMIVVVKDMTYAGLRREIFYEPEDIIQEVRTLRP